MGCADAFSTSYCGRVSRYVVCPATLLLVLEDGLTVADEHQLVGPASLRSQVLELLLHRVNDGRLTESQALQHHEHLTTMKLRLLNDRVSRRTAWDLARTNGWVSLRHAEFVAITTLQADALVTVDDELAAVASGIVPLVDLQALQAQS